MCTQPEFPDATPSSGACIDKQQRTASLGLVKRLTSAVPAVAQRNEARGIIPKLVHRNMPIAIGIEIPCSSETAKDSNCNRLPNSTPLILYP